MLGYSVQYAMLEITNWIKLGLIANSNYVGTHSYILPTLDLPAYAIHGGAQGSIYFNSPLACSTRTAHWQAPTHLLSRERMLTATYALGLRSMYWLWH